MSQTFELAKSRLQNLEAIEPLLSALRTLSMGTWHSALNKIENMKKYENKFSQILDEVLPNVQELPINNWKQHSKKASIADTIVLIIGSERGLCGKFNETLAKTAISWLNEKAFDSYQIWVLGSSMIKTLTQMKVDISVRRSMPSGTLISYLQCYKLCQDWLLKYENHYFDHFQLIFNDMEQGQHYTFSTISLLPFEIKPSPSNTDHEPIQYPAPIIETDPKGIYHQIIQHYVASSLYKILMKSSAAEHAARFRLMEDAKENAEEIINEMDQIINTERKRRITQQMQELAAGAGLLDNK